MKTAYSPHPTALPAAVAFQGKRVGTCFQVRDIAIEDNLRFCSGTQPDRLAKLQGALQCGTHCGSCLPELQRMVRSSPGQTNISIAAAQAA